MNTSEIPTRCLQCKGPYHEATGNYYEEWNVVFCGACYKPFVVWTKGMHKRKWGGEYFYDEAWSSIIAGGRRII